MELYVCGFNAHCQLVSNKEAGILQFEKVCRSPDLQVRCALWSSMVIQDDGTLIHSGFRPSGKGRVPIDGPPARNIRSIFGDTSGVLGALTKDCSLYLFHDQSRESKDTQLKKHRFSEDSFISKQNLAIEHLAIADNEEVCIITNSGARPRSSSGCTPLPTDETPRMTFSAPTSKLEIHTFASFQDFIGSNPPTTTVPIFSPVVSLLAGATSFTALTSSGEVLTWGSALHPQNLARTPTPTNPANAPASVASLGGIPIRKIAVGGWIGAALSEDNDLYVWGGHPGDAKRIKALPSLSDDEEVKLVDIDRGVDIMDVGVGSGHIVALTASGKIFATGDCESGQLGSRSQVFQEDWVEVKGSWRKGKGVRVGAGGWCSWAMIDTRAE